MEETGTGGDGGSHPPSVFNPRKTRGWFSTLEQLRYRMLSTFAQVSLEVAKLQTWEVELCNDLMFSSPHNWHNCWGVRSFHTNLFASVGSQPSEWDRPQTVQSDHLRSLTGPVDVPWVHSWNWSRKTVGI